MKNEQFKDQESTGPRESKEAGPTAAPSFTWKRLLGKKWVFPAVYVAAAALILTFMWVYQDSAKQSASDLSVVKSTTQEGQVPDGAALPVTAQVETMQWPVKDRNEYEVALPFYDEKASNDVKQAALIQYNNEYTAHLGIDLARDDNKSFDVLAAMSGKVTNVEKHPLLGNQVEITHSNGLVTVYESLGEVKVSKDMDVKKGEVIGQAGRNELEKDHGVHVHFEIRQGEDGPALNPNQYLSAASSESAMKQDAAKSQDANKSQSQSQNTAKTQDATKSQSTTMTQDATKSQDAAKTQDATKQQTQAKKTDDAGKSDDMDMTSKQHTAE